MGMWGDRREGRECLLGKERVAIDSTGLSALVKREEKRRDKVTKETREAPRNSEEEGERRQMRETRTTEHRI